MRSKRLIAAALAALLLVLALAGCSASQTEVYDDAPDLSDMIALPADGVQGEDGQTVIEDGDIPLDGAPGADSKAAAYVKEALELINKERAAQKLAPLSPLPALEAAAGLRAQELIKSFSHTRPDGSRYRTALEANGVKAGYTGENCGMGHRTPDAVVKSWMKSAGHRANILKAQYTHAGVGYCVDPKTGYAYWCLLLTSDPA